MLARLTRTLALLAGLVAGVGAVGWLCGRRWRRQAEGRLRVGSIVTQTDLGPVEYAIDGGGAPTLVIHGTPGGYDQAMLVRELLPQARPMVIGFSRPGYLRTPLSTGRTPSEQAAAAIALLDQLGVERVDVIGMSGGGPVALAFATEHPDRTRTLVLWGAVTRRTEVAVENLVRGPMTVDVVAWLALRVADLAPGLLLPSEVSRDPEALARVRQLMATSFPLDLRRAGIENDARQIAVLGDPPYEAVLAPTLVIHGTGDTNVDPETARVAAARIPNAKLVAVDGATHTGIAVHPEAVAAIEAFLAKPENALELSSA